MQRLWDWWTNDAVAFNDDPGVDRFFVVCAQCGRLRPYYQVVAKAKDAVMRCPRCGDNHVRPHTIANWRAAWALLVRGWFVRHVILRKQHQSEWDPRMPYRRVEFAGFQ